MQEDLSEDQKMSHKKLYNQGFITLEEFRELNLLKAQSKNPKFIKKSREEAGRLYKEKEKRYMARKKEKKKAYKSF